MPEEGALNQIERAAGRAGVRQAPLHRFTTIGTGGAAGLLIEATSILRLTAILATAREQRLPWFVLGKGSNLLVADEGFAGVVIVLSGELKECAAQGVRLSCGAGASLARAADIAARRSLTGLEPLAQIPGTLGGAVAVNAGSFGAEIGGLVDSLKVCSPEGCRTLEGSAVDFGYRAGLGPGLVIASVILKLKPGDPAAIREQMRDLGRRRQQSQPRGVRTFGSVFVNPPGASGAGRLLEEAGCKGLRAGAAAVSEAHANFIENRGNATTADVVELMKVCRQRVKTRFGIELSPEVRYLGAAGLEEVP